MLLVLIFQGGSAAATYGQSDRDRIDNFFGMLQFGFNLALLTNLMQYAWNKGSEIQKRNEYNPALNSIVLMFFSLVALEVDPFDRLCRGVGFEWTNNYPRKCEDNKSKSGYGIFLYLSTLFGMVLMFCAMMSFCMMYMPKPKVKAPVKAASTGPVEEERPMLGNAEATEAV